MYAIHINQSGNAFFGQAGDCQYRKSSSSEIGAMPFPPGVGGRGIGETLSNTESYEHITADRAIDESNVGNRILRSMGWQEGLVPPLISVLYTS